MSKPENIKLVLPEELQLTEETKQLISTLPFENDWSLLYLHQYQGFWLNTGTFQPILYFQNHFKAQSSDIALVTTPKSGTTWLKALVFALVNRVRYQNNDKHPLLTMSPHDLVPFTEVAPDLTNLSSPRLFSSHLPIGSLPQSIKDTSCKVVYLCRDPKDTFISLWHFTNKVRFKGMGSFSLEDAFDKFCRGVSIFGPFWDHVLGYWKESLKNPDKVLFLKYEEMKEQPHINLKKLAEFLGCPFTTQEETNGTVGDILKLCSFDNLSSQEINKTGMLNPYVGFDAFFRRGTVGDWTNYMTPELGKKLDELVEQKLHGSGLKF